jgi:uncharacterized coiled-coil protein SlyX
MIPIGGSRFQDDVIRKINNLNIKYETHINALQIQIKILTELVNELKNINIRVDNKTNDMCDVLSNIEDNTK